MNLESYRETKSKFLSGDYSGEKFFRENDCFLEYGYCKFLQGKLDEAKQSFDKIKSFDFRASWALKLIQFILSSNITMPSYFQIRNFLEIDLNLLLQAGQAEFIENILKYSDLLYKINPETYKFISRVMLNNNFEDVAIYYLMKAKDKFYYDPEMHFMLANCYIKKGDKSLAKESLKVCLSILPRYYPAKKLLDSLSS